MPLDGTYEPSPVDRSRKQVELYERTDGAEGATMRGMPVVILTSVGAKSTKLRKTPLMRVEHEGQYAVVASLGGAEKHPVWYYNVAANPHVELRDGAMVRDYLARELSGAERDVWWERSVAAYPDYADYARKTDRLIPVFVLEPIEADVENEAAGTDEATGADGAETANSAAIDDEGLPYERAETEQEEVERATVLDDEIAEFWENARGRAGLGKIAVVGGLTVSAGVAPVAWAFGDNPVLADELLDAVLSGDKTATSSALEEYDDEDTPIPTVGELSIILDGAGHPRALIRTTAVETVPFDEVTEEFAAAEGEDDRTLESWRREHDVYFRRTLGYEALPADFKVVTERFEVLFPK